MNRKGFTLIELLVVISIIAILAGLLLPTIATIRENARKQENGNNQKRIIEGMIAYSTDEGTFAWPSGADSSVVSGMQAAGPNGADAGQVEFVGLCFQLLAKANDLPGKLFANPAATVKLTKSDALPADYAGVIADTNNLRYKFAASYAYDWTAPQNAASGRPVTADRETGFWGGKGATVAYGDGHTGFLKVDPDATDPHDTFIVISASAAAADDTDDVVYSTEYGISDNLYDANNGNGEKVVADGKVGRGSSTLAWVR